MEKLEVAYIATTDLIPYANNPRTHSEQQVAQVAASIKEFGFNNPILIDEHNGIIAGHGRLAAAQKLDLKLVPTIMLEGLTEAQRKAYVIADNKLTENGGWDHDLLAVEIERLKELDVDVDLTGFDPTELDKILEPEVIQGLTDEDEVPEAPEEPITKRGDVWILGNHRLMCGDSTSVDDVDRLMAGQKADLVFTDPPYNVAFNGRSGKHDVIKNDDLTAAEFREFIQQVCSVITYVDPKAYYVWCNWSFYGLLQEMLPFKTCIVWAKNVFGMGVGYRHQHEFCLFNGKIDEAIKNESDLWSVKKDHSYVHPTQKPVELAVRAFSNHIRLVNVLDLFGGSGSTLIGAEQTGRNCFVMELDPKYCDVIVDRWQSFTSKTAQLDRPLEAVNG